MKNAEQPAYSNRIYPEFAEDFKNGFAVTEGINPTGLTKRELIAAMALQGILAHSTNYMAAAHSDAVKDAIKCADELLKMLEQ